MATHYPSHSPADPTASSSSSRGTSDDPHFRPTSTESGTPLAAALQLEKPPSREDGYPSQQRSEGNGDGGIAKGKKKKPHFKSFAEIADENLRKAEAGAGKRDPWITRKFAIGLVFAIVGYTSYVVIGRICVPMLDPSSRLGSRARAIAFLTVYCLLLFFFIWSYVKVILTGPGFAKDYAPPFQQIPTNPYELQPHAPFAHQAPPPPPPINPEATASQVSLDVTALEDRPPSPRPTNPLPLPPAALPHPHPHHDQPPPPPPPISSGPPPMLQRDKAGGLCSVPPLFDQRRAEEGLAGQTQVPRGGMVERVPFEPEIMGRWCGFCQIVKPERAHHCRMCGECVLNMDHHCPWIGTCVGARNHKFFLNFCVFSTLYTTFTLIVCAIELQRSDYDPFLISIIALSTLFTLFTTSMSSTHSWLILINMSTIEQLRVSSWRARESSLLSLTHGSNPFSRSRRANLRLLEKQWGSPYKEGNPFFLSYARNWRGVMGERWWEWGLPLGGGRGEEMQGGKWEREGRCGERGEWRRREVWEREVQEGGRE